MKEKTEITNGKKRMIITNKASGVDKTKEAVLLVMGPGWEYKNQKKEVAQEVKVQEQLKEIQNKNN